MAYELELPDLFCIHPVFHVTLLKTDVTNPFPGRSTDPPEPVLVNGKEEFEVESILDCRKRRNQVQFLVKWKGYGPKENSWEPERNIHAKRLIRTFKDSHPLKMTRLGIRRLPIGGGQCHRRGRPLGGANGAGARTGARNGAPACTGARNGAPARTGARVRGRSARTGTRNSSGYLMGLIP